MYPGSYVSPSADFPPWFGARHSGSRWSICQKSHRQLQRTFWTHLGSPRRWLYWGYRFSERMHRRWKAIRIQETSTWCHRKLGSNRIQMVRKWMTWVKQFHMVLMLPSMRLVKLQDKPDLLIQWGINYSILADRDDAPIAEKHQGGWSTGWARRWCLLSCQYLIPIRDRKKGELTARFPTMWCSFTVAEWKCERYECAHHKECTYPTDRQPDSAWYLVNTLGVL